jgi:MoaA/NifB/PqqE/SkfB family radical SAM enzyme
MEVDFSNMLPQIREIKARIHHRYLNTQNLLAFRRAKEAMRFRKTSRLAFLNFLQSKYEAWTGAVVVQSHPYYLGIDPTSICQLRCPLCPTGVENESRRQNAGQAGKVFRNRTMLTPETLDALLEELGEYLFLITFYNWGEPLLNKNLPSFIQKAKVYEIYTEIHTNLSLPLSDAFIDSLLASGTDNIEASIDGLTQESYEKYRRGGNVELAKSNIVRLARARDRLGLKTNIIWNFLGFSFNEHDIPAALQFCVDHHILFKLRDAFVADPDWLPSYRKAKANVSRGPAPQTTQVRKPSPAIKPVPSPCAWHYGYSTVNANGTVSPCCALWEQKDDFGQVSPGETSFTTIWNNVQYQKSRAAFANKSLPELEDVDTVCLRCPYDASMQNLYSVHDQRVLHNFRTVCKGTEEDKVLTRAFNLLSNREVFVKYCDEYVRFPQPMSIQ